MSQEDVRAYDAGYEAGRRDGGGGGRLMLGVVIGAVSASMYIVALRWMFRIWW